MKTIKKLALIAILGVGVFEQTARADQATQDKIRRVIQHHQADLNKVKTKEDLKKFLHPLIKDLREAVKHAPNTSEYKKLKEALNAINADQIISIVNNLKTILNHLEPDIKQTIIDSIPLTFRALLLI